MTDDTTASGKVELRIEPCAFCGTEHDQRLNAHGFGNYSISCGHCRATQGQWKGQAQTIIIWNTRTTPPLEEEVNRLREGLENSLLAVKVLKTVLEKIHSKGKAGDEACDRLIEKIRNLLNREEPK